MTNLFKPTCQRGRLRKGAALASFFHVSCAGLDYSSNFATAS
jgi:hypothetical protein